MLFSKNYYRIRGLCLLGCIFILPICTFAQKSPIATETSVTNPYDALRYTLVVIAALMALVIGVLGNAVIVTSKIFWEKQKETRDIQKKDSILAKGAILMLAMACSHGVFAQEVKKTVDQSPGLPTDLYVFFSVIGVEFIIILFLVYALMVFIDKKKKVVVSKAKPAISWFQKINKTVPLEKEYILDLHHNYDGIRELDNNIPGWWKLAFLGTFLFGLVYMYRLFGSETMPRQTQELAMSNKEAALQKLEYLKDAANNIDENNVVMLDSTGVESGRGLYLKNCVACHGDKGQGGVGPNLTDEYWLHEGDLHKIFYSIKYGWQEKGMKSWKEDFSPQQISQLASFVHSIKNTHAAGGKDKQGELDKEPEAGASASVTMKKL